MPEVLAGSRRPLKSRKSGWARAMAAWLAGRGVRPNAVSLASVAFAALAAVSLWQSLRPHGETDGILLVAAAAAIQLRLLCNLLDGLIAVEGGLGSPQGEIYNDLPDRFADAMIFAGAGLALRALPYGMTLGWVAALASVVTAYVRVLGGAVGLPQDFRGPMAKQHRMAATTAGCLAGAVEAWFHRPPRLLFLAVAIVVLGCAVTIARRTAGIAAGLGGRGR
jgi:phosphatidylglycerophosphate synthase